MARVAPTRLHAPAPSGRATRRSADARVVRRGMAVWACRDDNAVDSTSSCTSAPTPLLSESFGRREALGSVAALTAGLMTLTPGDARAVVEEATTTARPVPDYTARGSYGVKRLPKLEHTCVSCFPRCVGDACLLSIDVYVPTPPPVLPDAMFPIVGSKGEEELDGTLSRSRGPYPLAVFTSGFLVDSEQYASYARRLCSWGYVVLQYNKRENVAGGNALDDLVSAQMIKDLIGWAQSDVLLGQLVDTKGEEPSAGVYLVGHSRGGKISTLEALEDPRVRAACLLDPVDNTVYAPLGVGFPSAVAAMQEGGEEASTSGRTPPLVVVGGARGGDCTPKGSNYVDFVREASADSWGVEIAGAGHFQFLDNATFVQRAVCEEGFASESEVRGVSQALMVAHAETIFRGVTRDAALRETLGRLEDEFGNGVGSKIDTDNAAAPWTVLRGWER